MVARILAWLKWRNCRYDAGKDHHSRSIGTFDAAKPKQVLDGSGVVLGISDKSGSDNLQMDTKNRLWQSPRSLCLHEQPKQEFTMNSFKTIDNYGINGQVV
ncbi:hypothetical protein VNO77_22787 [Canavalia gladiata]|uniref:Uncharacterized protein n=1 Tax=Canavalia gladiata TaxID=3824 RepID=A0AAN9Q8B0_CANGL